MASPWPQDAGASLTLMTHHSPGAPANWRSSTTPTPGFSDTTPFTGNSTLDMDQDGLTTLLEYILGSSDSDATDAHRFLPVITSDLTLKIDLAAKADQSTLAIQSSDNLIDWHPAPIHNNLLSNQVSNDRWLLSFSLPADGRKFYRLSVTHFP